MLICGMVISGIILLLESLFAPKSQNAAYDEKMIQKVFDLRSFLLRSNSKTYQSMELLKSLDSFIHENRNK